MQPLNVQFVWEMKSHSELVKQRPLWVFEVRSAIDPKQQHLRSWEQDLKIIFRTDWTNNWKTK